VPEILIQIKEVNTPVRFHQCIIKQWNKISMDGKGRAIDNIFIERLWRTVKYENVYLYTDGISLYRGLKDYFEFYNTRRLHQSLDYGTPYNNYYKEVA
jgi:putative transposase